MSLRRHNIIRMLLVAGTALSALPAAAQITDTPAPAQDGSTAALDTQGGEEIVVVARRREERLIDVPIAVTALSADQLAKSQAFDLAGVQGTIPNVNLCRAAARPATPTSSSAASASPTRSRRSTPRSASTSTAST